MTVQGRGREAVLSLDGWDCRREPVEPLPGQVGLFEYRPHAVEHGQGELFDTGRDLPGVEEHAQRILWDLEA
jgi:hypothetical protein